MSKYLIIADGQFLPKSIILEAAENAIIMALDGAADKLAHLGIKPDIILGDLDSLKKNSEKSYSDNDGVTIVQLLDQNFTDFQKALKFAIHHANQYDFPLATSIHVVCAMGERMDHEQANIRALQTEYAAHCPIYLHNEYQAMTFAHNQTVIIQGHHHDYCGLFGMPEATMSVKNGGLEYGSEKPHDLSPSQFSSSNRLIGNNGAVVEIKGKALIIHPPMLTSQRIFSQKSRLEQLTELLKTLIENTE